MDTYTDHARRIREFENKMGMFLHASGYDEICAFISGMNYCSKYPFLDGFNEWLNAEFELRTPFYWGALIEYVCTDEFKTPRSEAVEEKMKALLFSKLYKFLDEKSNASTSEPSA